MGIDPSDDTKHKAVNMKKQITVRVAGGDQIHDIEIEEGTTAAQVLTAVGCPHWYEIVCVLGTPPLKADEKVWDHVSDEKMVFALPELHVD